MSDTLADRTLACLRLTDPDAKCDAVTALRVAWLGGDLPLPPAEAPVEAIETPGRPALPPLVPPQAVERRSVGTPEGHAALIHALAHIEFNAINLALDAVCRYPGLPDAFYRDWLQVAAEEAYHFGLLRDHLRTLGCDYGDFPAHDGLIQMARDTADDPLARMALVPRLRRLPREQAMTLQEKIAALPEWPHEAAYYYAPCYEAALARLALAREALQEARDGVADWAEYAGAYFKEKHRLADELAAYDAVIKALAEP